MIEKIFIVEPADLNAVQGANEKWREVRKSGRLSQDLARYFLKT
jgi:hypothetical protein